MRIFVGSPSCTRRGQLTAATLFLACSTYSHALDRPDRMEFVPPAAGTYQLQRIMTAPEGMVVDSDGSQRKLSSYITGKITLFSFIYTYCTDAKGCPLAYATLHKLKTGCLFGASVGLALWAAGVPEGGQAPWRAFGDELGLLFQIVDDILDGDGYVVTQGVDGARRLADEAAERARERLAAVAADTSVLREIVDGLAVRTA